MAENSNIEWTTHTLNPWRGCEKVSAGCQNCYAETGSKRNGAVLGVWGSEKAGGTRVVAAEAQWKLPAKWNAEAAKAGERHRVFCASYADVFEDWRGPMQTSTGVQMWRRGDDSWTTSDHYPDTVALTMDDVRKRLFALIAMTPCLDWLLLTKRPQNITPTLSRLRDMGLVASDHFPWANVWLGTTAENQQQADERIPHLLAAPAAVRFLSCEPLLSAVNLPLLVGCRRCNHPGNVYPRDGCPRCGGTGHESGIHWVIVGGESGPGARPMQVAWARSLVKQCRDAGVKCFVKQMGADPVALLNLPLVRPDGERLSDKKGGDIDEFPADLRVREFPEATR